MKLTKTRLLVILSVLVLLGCVAAVMLANRGAERITLEEFIEDCVASGPDYDATSTIGVVLDEMERGFPTEDILPPEILQEHVDAGLAAARAWQAHLSTFHRDTHYVDVIRLGGTQELLDAQVRFLEATLAIPEPAYTAMAEAGCIQERRYLEMSLEGSRAVN